MGWVLTPESLSSLRRNIHAEFSGGFDINTYEMCTAIVGSTAHNTYVKKEDITSDDIDISGVFCSPPDYILSLKNIETWAEAKEINGIICDWTFRSLKHYCKLLMSCNPDVLCLLYLEPRFYLYKHKLFDELIANRDLFLSIKAYDSFAGYAFSQSQRMERIGDLDKMGEKRKNLVLKYGYDVKNAAHCLRILYMGIDLVKTGTMTVWQPEERAGILRDIKQGNWKVQEVKDLITESYDELRKVKEDSPLNKNPHFHECNELITKLHLKYWYETGDSQNIGL